MDCLGAPWPFLLIVCWIWLRFCVQRVQEARHVGLRRATLAILIVFVSNVFGSVLQSAGDAIVCGRTVAILIVVLSNVSAIVLREPRRPGMWDFVGPPWPFLLFARLEFGFGSVLQKRRWQGVMDSLEPP